MSVSRRAFAAGLAASSMFFAPRPTARAQGASGVEAARFRHLAASYPDLLAGIEDVMLVWKDGTRMPLDDGKAGKSFEQMLRSASLADQMRQVYRAGRPSGIPQRNDSPGRIRHAPFFAKMYGDCTKGGVAPQMRPVIWMPKTKPQTIAVTKVNNVAGRLEKVIAGLEALPDRFKAYLIPSAGTYNCRVVADTGQPSMHASGAAIDIATAQTDYWVWAKGKAAGDGLIPFRNRIPWEIAEIFEAEGFIWGGKWYHYDTMHFEYRPEMFG